MGEPDKSEWVIVGSREELRDRGHLTVRLPSGSICVLEVDGELHALDAACPHMGSELYRGEIADGFLICPWHRARFNLMTGRSLDLYADDIATYDLVEHEGVVLVDPTPRSVPEESVEPSR